MSAASRPADHQRVFAAILSELMHRRRPTRQRLQEVTELTGREVDEALMALAQARVVVRDGDGELVAAYPLSAVPTRHVVELGFAAPWANCAIDALAVPAMVRRNGTVRSRCAYCDKPITVEVEGTSVHRAHPVGTVIAYGGLADWCDRPSIEGRCPFINFFCSLEHAQAWQPPAAWQGQLMPLDEAVTFAVEHFRPVIDIYTRHNVDGGPRR